jgi:hypothetical protein
LTVYERLLIELFSPSPDGIYWREIFHDTGRNLTIYQSLLADFVCMKFRLHLLKLCSSSIREGTWRFTKDSLSILFSPSPDGIYWRWALPP